MSRARSILEKVEQLDGVKFSTNPRNLDMLLKELESVKGHAYNGPGLLEIRLLGHVPSQDVFAWAAGQDTHFSAARKLGVDYDDCILGYLQQRSAKVSDLLQQWGIADYSTDGWHLTESTGYRVKELPGYRDTLDKMKRLES